MNAFYRRLSLRQITILLLVSVGVLPFWLPLWPNYSHFPQYDIRTFTPTAWSGLVYALWLLVTMGLCWVAYQRVRRMAEPPRWLWVVALAVVLALLFLWVYPVNATDVYRYFIRGRVSSVYQANPFAVAPAQFPEDPYLPLAGEWASHTSPYGPVWELLAGLITRLFPQKLLLGLLAFKMVGALAFVGSGLLLWGILDKFPLGERLGRTLLWLWNPALLLIFVADGHNDGLMLFWLLLGVWLWHRGRVTLAWLVLPLAPLTKLIGLLALPFIFLGFWHTLNPARPFALSPARGRLFFLALSSSLLLGFLAFLPFGSPLDLAVRLVQESRDGAGFSPLVLLYFGERFLGLSPSLSGLANAGTGVFGLLGVGLLVGAVRGRVAYRGISDIFAGYMAQALSFRIWYAAWFFPWTLADAEERRLRVGFVFLLTTQLSVLIYGHLRIYLLAGDMGLAHLLGIPFTFLLPLLLAGAGSAHIPHSDTPQIEK